MIRNTRKFLDRIEKEGWLPPEDIKRLRKYFDFYSSLETGSRSPDNPERHHFVQMCLGKCKPVGPHEHAYSEYMRWRSVIKRGNTSPKRPTPKRPSLERPSPKRPSLELDGRTYERKSRKWLDTKKFIYPAAIIASRLDAKAKTHGMSPNCQAWDEYDLVQSHREYVESKGEKYKGVTRRSKKGHRKTHCYQCQKELDNAIDYECLNCKWMLCWCGACGCGYKAGWRS